MGRLKNKTYANMSDSELNSRVLIAGTKHERKKRISDATAKEIQRRYAKGESINKIALALGVSYVGVQGIAIDGFKEWRRANRPDKSTHYGPYQDKHELADYKRKLLLDGCRDMIFR